MENIGMTEIINAVKKRPGAYIGCNKLTPMKHFLDGCYFYKKISSDDVIKNIIPLDYAYFYYFMCSKAGESLNCGGYVKYILDICGGDEEAALKKFFEFYDEFSAVNIVRCKKAVLSAENIEAGKSRKYYGLGGEHPFFGEPLFAYIIELSIPAYLTAVEEADEIQLAFGLVPTYEDAERSLSSYFGEIRDFSGDDLNISKRIKRGYM